MKCLAFTNRWRRLAATSRMKKPASAVRSCSPTCRPASPVKFFTSTVATTSWVRLGACWIESRPENNRAPSSGHRLVSSGSVCVRECSPLAPRAEIISRSEMATLKFARCRLVRINWQEFAIGLNCSRPTGPIAVGKPCAPSLPNRRPTRLFHRNGDHFAGLRSWSSWSSSPSSAFLWRSCFRPCRRHASPLAEARA